MAKKLLSTLESLMSSTEDLLENISVVDNLIKNRADQPDSSEHSILRRTAMDSLEVENEIPGPPLIELDIAPDKMRCTATISPDIAGQIQLDVYNFYDELSRNGIVFGIERRTIEEAVFRCNTEGVPISDILVAQGQPPLQSIPEHVVIETHLLEPPTKVDLESEQIDFKERSPFVFVKSGTLLARRVPAQYGIPGKTIYGVEIPVALQQVPTITASENTVERDGNIYATIDGRFVFYSGTFMVSPVLDITGDVNYSTGHIDFSGDVNISGNILEGFNVRAVGALYCAQTVYPSTIECGKELIVGRGIIGRETTSVKAHGDLICKYIEHCYVEAGGSVRVITGSMNAIVNTLGTFSTGPRGIIVGGVIHAQNGVAAGQIGTEMGPRTEIYCGVDHTVLSRLEWIRDRNIELAKKLSEVKRSILSVGDPQGSLAALETKIREAIRKMNDASMNLVSHLDKKEDAEVRVRETVYPNTYIEICHASYIVTRRLRNVVFILNRETGKIAFK